MTQFETLSEDDRVMLLRRHKGLLRKVASACHVSPSLVSRVYHGKARSREVERQLRKALARLGTLPVSAGRSSSPASSTGELTHRNREFQWLADHRQDYAGKWVALDGYQLIASADHARDVLAAARQSGRSPMIHFIEPLDAPLLGGW